jgi:SAM-dependent methyltransferase
MLSFAPAVPGDAWLVQLDELARSRLGQSPRDSRALAHAVAELSQAYTRRAGALRDPARDPNDLWARLCFFLPRDLAKVQLPLLELDSVGALPRRDTLRVLDLGAGLGAVSLGIAQLALRSGFTRSLEVTAVDSDAAALELFEALVPHCELLPAVPVRLTRKVADLTRLPPGLLEPRYDLIVLGLALNELNSETDTEALLRAETLLVRLAGALVPDGALIVIEPALRDTSRALQALRDRLAARRAAPFVFAPCVRSGPCPMLAAARDWCHERVPMQLPPRLAELAQLAGLRDRDLTFSYLTLHAAARSLAERSAARSLVERTTEPQRPYRVVSGPLRSKGKLELIACGEQGLTRR